MRTIQVVWWWNINSPRLYQSVSDSPMLLHTCNNQSFQVYKQERREEDFFFLFFFYFLVVIYYLSFCYIRFSSSIHKKKKILKFQFKARNCIVLYHCQQSIYNYKNRKKKKKQKTKLWIWTLCLSRLRAQ